MMSCRHRPISNGWSSGGGRPPTTWCGRCKDNVRVDVRWANAYYDTKRKRAQRQVDSGYAGMKILDSVEEDRVSLIREIEKYAKPEQS